MEAWIKLRWKKNVEMRVGQMKVSKVGFPKTGNQKLGIQKVGKRPYRPKKISYEIYR